MLELGGSEHEILSIMNNLQVQNLDADFSFWASNKVSSFTESLQAGSVMVREKEGSRCQQGYEAVLLLAGETLIGSWQIKEAF